MKKILFVILAALLCAATALALEPTYTSGEKTTDGAGWAHPCYVVKVKGKTDGTNNLTLKVYDNASAASGTVITEFTIVGADHKGGETFENLDIKNGVFVDMTTSGTGSWWIEFKKK